MQSIVGYEFTKSNSYAYTKLAYFEYALVFNEFCDDLNDLKLHSSKHTFSELRHSLGQIPRAANRGHQRAAKEDLI